MELTLHLVRHGETAWNAEGRMQGSVDVPLNATGLAQAEASAGILADRAIGAGDFGVVEGRLYDDAKAEYGDRWDILLRGDEDHFEGGESTHQHYDRVAAFMDGLVAAPPANELVLVSHGGTVRRARAPARRLRG